jgi:hypothetical protein
LVNGLITGGTAKKATYVMGVIVVMVEVTTGMDSTLEQNAVAAARVEMTEGLDPVGSRQRSKLSLLHVPLSSSNGEAKEGTENAARSKAPWRSMDGILLGFSKTVQATEE